MPMNTSANMVGLITTVSFNKRSHVLSMMLRTLPPS